MVLVEWVSGARDLVVGGAQNTLRVFEKVFFEIGGMWGAKLSSADSLCH
jgi:hypothetical protein